MKWFIAGIVAYHIVVKIIIPALRMSQKYRTVLEEEDADKKEDTSTS